MPSLIVWLALLVPIWYAIRYWGFPLLLSRLFKESKFSATRLSPFSARGVEWRYKKDAILPTLRLERYDLRKSREGETGFFVLALEGFGFWVPKEIMEKSRSVNDTPKPPRRISRLGTRILTWITHFLIQQSPMLAQVLSVSITDSRVILTELDGLEITLKRFTIGTVIDFKSRDDAAPPSGIMSPPMSPNLDSASLSPPSSPLAYMSFKDPFTASPTPIPAEEPVSSGFASFARLSQAKRKATVSYIRVTSTTGQIFRRAMGRAHGSVSFNITFTDIAVILPHDTAHAENSRQALPQAIPSPGCKTRFTQFKSPPFLRTLSAAPPQLAAANEGLGFSTLATLKGVSTVRVGLGFGPRKGWLAEDTLTAEINLADLGARMDGLERVSYMLKRRKQNRRAGDAAKTGEKKNPWAPSALPRVILRAIEKLTFGIASSSISYHLPKSSTPSPSTSSSATDLTATDLPPINTELGEYIISLDVARLFIALATADSTNNGYAKDAFGTNDSEESRIRGVGFGVHWENMVARCLSPGQAINERAELLGVRQVDLEGLSTWRPSTWSREEMLFADDPNVSLVVGQCALGAIDISADLRLVEELQTAFKAYDRPRYDRTPDEDVAKSSTEVPAEIVGDGASKASAKVSSEPVSPGGDRIPTLPPRIRFGLQIGPIIASATQLVGDKRITVSSKIAGGHIGCSSSFEDIVARRKMAEQRKAFRDEAGLLERRESAGRDYDAALTPSMHRPQYRRIPIRPANLSNEHTFRMLVGAGVSLEPIQTSLTIGNTGSDSESKSYDIATVGAVYTKLTVSIPGRTNVAEDGSDISQLDMTNRSSVLDIGIYGGVQVDFSDPSVMDALVWMGERHKRALNIAPSNPKPPVRPFDKLPSGLAMSLSLGRISAIVASVDPNPQCQKRLVRGLWLQTNVNLAYAQYTHPSQYPDNRLSFQAGVHRADLRLGPAITTQAMAFSEEGRSSNGRAALMEVSVKDTCVKPVVDAARFAQADGLEHEIRRRRVSKKQQEKMSHQQKDEYFGPQTPQKVHQAQLPMLDLSDVTVKVTLRQPNPDHNMTADIMAKLSRPKVRADMSYIYCTLLAAHSLRRLSSAWKSRSDTTKTTTFPTSTSLLDISARFEIPAAIVHIALPVREHLILHIGEIKVNSFPQRGIVGDVDGVLAYVMSREKTGEWEELGRIGKLHVAVPLPQPQQPKCFSIDMERFRMRIAPRYKMADLILDVNVSIKALKTLVQNVKGDQFLTRHEPHPEEPKRIPTIRISVKMMSLEALDDAFDLQQDKLQRIGLVEQEGRLDLEDAFQAKLDKIQNPGLGDSEDDLHATLSGRAGLSKLTSEAKIPAVEAREALDKYQERHLKRAHKQGSAAIRDEEVKKRRPHHFRMPDCPSHIQIVEREPAPPLFRVSIEDLNLDVSALLWPKEKVVDYMSECSATPFDDGADFSLMVPLSLKWAMGSFIFALRDYPLPLVRIRSSSAGVPAWSVETPFIIAEEYHGIDTWFEVPVTILPQHNESDVPLVIVVNKTISPVKTYTQPIVKIESQFTSEFVWGNSYQPAIQDMMRIIDTMTSAPKDPSQKPGFWDKFRLTTHWRIELDFTGPVHLHSKGASEPYGIEGHAAGGAFAWHRGCRFRIGYPNEQYELIQAESEAVMLVVPNLLADDDAIGLQEQYTKPIASFEGGIRIGFGFKFESTCRPWNCTEGCGPTIHKARRECRRFVFKRHQDVILRNKKAVSEAVDALGHESDSFEGFRSDFIHFSMSCVSTRAAGTDTRSPGKVNAIHLSPHFSAHFSQWWGLFNSAMSIPIKKNGPLFPDSPVAHVKFGKSLGTIKYKIHITDLYISHVYSQPAEAGTTPFLGVKAYIGVLDLDAHQRRQERRVGHEKLSRTQIVPHKPFNAIGVCAQDVVVKGVSAVFSDSHQSSVVPASASPDASTFVSVSELPEEKAKWYNFADYIDVDRTPIDHNPRFRLVDIADCPRISYSMRKRAFRVSSWDEEIRFDKSAPDVETTKFGHEDTHICMLGSEPSANAIQRNIIGKRQSELRKALTHLQDHGPEDHKLTEAAYKKRLASLMKEMDTLTQEKKDCDSAAQSLDPIKDREDRLCSDEDVFRVVLHVHCPRMVWTEAVRDLVFRYFHSRQDRKREEDVVSYKSLEPLRKGFTRMSEQTDVDRRNDSFSSADDTSAEKSQKALTAASFMAYLLEQAQRNNHASKAFDLPDVTDSSANRYLAQIGIPVESFLIAKYDISVFQPQIVFKSDTPDDAGVVGNSVVLVAADRVVIRSYDVQDAGSEHRASEPIFTRFYIQPKDVQAFYPSDANMRQSQATGQGVGFIPLEIFYDDKNEAVDFTRIVSKTDMMISFDKFNKLRLPTQLEWPDACHPNGQPVDHLRLHQDLLDVKLPRLTVSATSKDYTAIYNIVTKLLVYSDPIHAARSLRVNKFLLGFVTSDGNLKDTIIRLAQLQRDTKKLGEMIRGLEADFKLLTEEELSELSLLRTTQMEGMEDLFTVFEAVTVAIKQQKAKAALVHSSKIDVWAGDIGWMMLAPDGQPLVKLNVKDTLFSRVTNKDGSTDQALRIQGVKAHNSNHRANRNFVEVLDRLLGHGDETRGSDDAFFSAAWTMLNQVGGITIIKDARYDLYPTRIAIERELADEVQEYIFPGGKRKKEQEKRDKKAGSRFANDGGSRDTLSRVESSASIASQATGDSRMGGEAKSNMVSDETDIMQQRARSQVHFDSLVIRDTVVSVSFKKRDKFKRQILVTPDVTDLRLRVLGMNFTAETCSYSELFDKFKKHIASSALKQSGSIVMGLFTKSSIFKSRSTISKMSDKISSKASIHHPPTISESSPLRRVISTAVSLRHPEQNDTSPTPSPQSSPVSENRTLISNGEHPGPYRPHRRQDVDWDGSESDEWENAGHDGKAVARVKELWGRIGRKSREGSAEESRGSASPSGSDRKPYRSVSSTSAPHH